MGVLSFLARPALQASVTSSPLDQRWYSDVVGSRSDAGPVIVPEAALTNAVIYRAVNVLAHSVASIPLVVFRRLDNEGKEKAREHPAYDLLHDKPNAWQTSFRWRHLVMTQAILWGDHYSEIMPGPGGMGAFVPLSPDTTRPVDQLRDGRLLYTTRDKTERGYGPERRIVQDEMIHVRGFSLDGKRGIGIPKLARNAIGLALAAERHGSLFMRRGARFAGFLSTPGGMKEPERTANEAAWQRMRGGDAGTGTTPILTHGMKFENVTSNNKDSQWLEARTFEVEELLRFIGVPGVLCGYADKTATYASAEQFFLSFVTHTVRPWTVNIEQELNGSVITDGPDHFCLFILEGLLRGDITTRYTAHQMAIVSGWKTRNEARVEENYNRGPAELDEFQSPLNMGGAGGERAGRPPAPRRAPDPDDAPDDEEETDARAQLAAIARGAVVRLVQKEVTAIGGTNGKLGAAGRFAGNPDGWHAWLAEFYAAHAIAVATALQVTPAAATAYCDVQQRCARSGPESFSDFELDSVARLMKLTPVLEDR